MKIIDKNISEIINNKEIKSNFLSVDSDKLNMKCNILNNNFFMDSHNYFPITEDHYTFKNIFMWGDVSKYNNFYTNLFIENFKKEEKNFIHLSDTFILGSSSVNNYYRNMITFIPRIFFLHKKKIKLGIHRSLSKKFRDFILYLSSEMKKEVQFVFLDDGFYKFTNSQLPEFFPKKDSVNILNKLKISQKKPEDKIYLTRQNASYRNLLNESDVVNILKSNGFKIIDLNEIEIIDQIKLFSNAKMIISSAGSSLANIVFCSPGTKVIEISPKYSFDYENIFKVRYEQICNQLNLEYLSIEADSININIKKNISQKFISPLILNQSNYYKDMILKIDNIKKILVN